MLHETRSPQSNDAIGAVDVAVIAATSAMAKRAICLWALAGKRRRPGSGFSIGSTGSTG
jgi:hypothetical protein